MPYEILQSGNNCYFDTDSGVTYVVSIELSDCFVDESYSFYKQEVYWISFDHDGESRENDPKATSTIQLIIDQWISTNNKILFFVCSNKWNKQEARIRRFGIWAAQYPDRFQFNRVDTRGEKSGITYSGFLVRKDYLHLEKYNQDFPDIKVHMQRQKDIEDQIKAAN